MSILMADVLVWQAQSPIALMLLNVQYSTVLCKELAIVFYLFSK